VSRDTKAAYGARINDIKDEQVMARGPLPFTQADVKRVLRGAVAAGVEIARVEIDPRSGHIVILTPRDSITPVAPYDVWKAESHAR
jgi:hypothetical protein